MCQALCWVLGQGWAQTCVGSRARHLGGGRKPGHNCSHCPLMACGQALAQPLSTLGVSDGIQSHRNRSQGQEAGWHEEGPGRW